MVVLADDPLLRADVPIVQEHEQVVCIVVPLGKGNIGLDWRGEGRLAGDLRPSLVEEVHRQVADLLAVVAER